MQTKPPQPTRKPSCRLHRRHQQRTHCHQPMNMVSTKVNQCKQRPTQEQHRYTWRLIDEMVCLWERVLFADAYIYKTDKYLRDIVAGAHNGCLITHVQHTRHRLQPTPTHISQRWRIHRYTDENNMIAEKCMETLITDVHHQDVEYSSHHHLVVEFLQQVPNLHQERHKPPTTEHAAVVQVGGPCLTYLHAPGNPAYHNLRLPYPSSACYSS